ncbi:unnamed protein product [Schistosoma mattheei]|uniref:Uncharacterized protein n=1 Tax=Schistosoma mattheei TaxID=31246 RepID=A0A183P873_9TREM|nr:unnamed protein product [Schistosoma mattheei]
MNSISIPLNVALLTEMSLALSKISELSSSIDTDKDSVPVNLKLKKHGLTSISYLIGMTDRGRRLKTQGAIPEGNENCKPGWRIESASLTIYSSTPSGDLEAQQLIKKFPEQIP